MEETSSSTIASQKSTQELAMEGQKHLEDTIESANGHHAPSNGVSNGDATSSDTGHHFEMGGGALDEARLRYKSSVAALRSVLTAIPNSRKAKAYDIDPMSTDNLDAEKLEERASALRKDLENKNKHLKVLIDQLRELITDVSTWQSPVPI
ncbi:hypothetical protein OSB04_004182 [Centaurea solstitialis]|uniref:Mediator of RNA polymerase II transcription subunit 30 n=1 Tax=Centaurea solstitialis TaxID=347529 RepID=A0AA38U8Q2_9ASTR|nr:hypothetical protein OSB04_004182 [Centaurea solstitialis]